MARKLSTALLVIVGLINFAPIIGILSAERLQGLYGLAFEDPSLVVLMRHRAALFGIVGGFILVSAFHRPLRRIGMGMALLSMASYMGLVWTSGEANEALRRVALVDVFAMACLAGAFLIDRFAEER